MRALLLVVTLGAAMSAQGQSGGAAASSTSQAAAAAQTRQSANVSAGEATQVSAELTKNLDSKKAKVGDEVLAKTTSKARLTDGTMLPRGTKLVGKVTDVQAKAGAAHASRLAFAFDHAVMHDGSQVPVRAMLQSIAAPTAATTAGMAQDDSISAGPAGASAGGGARSGGMIGGAAGGVARPIGGAVGSTTRGVEDTAAGAESTVGGAVQGTSAAANAAVSAGVVTGPVANLPGVTFSSTASGNGEAVLQGSGRNIELASGTQMSLGVTATH
jgi:hypothetical protein